jgi:hypothetical protein
MSWPVVRDFTSLCFRNRRLVVPLWAVSASLCRCFDVTSVGLLEVAQKCPLLREIHAQIKFILPTPAHFKEFGDGKSAELRGVTGIGGGAKAKSTAAGAGATTDDSSGAFAPPAAADGAAAIGDALVLPPIGRRYSAITSSRLSSRVSTASDDDATSKASGGKKSKVSSSSRGRSSARSRDKDRDKDAVSETGGSVRSGRSREAPLRPLPFGSLALAEPLLEEDEDEYDSDSDDDSDGSGDGSGSGASADRSASEDASDDEEGDYSVSSASEHEEAAPPPPPPVKKFVRKKPPVKPVVLTKEERMARDLAMIDEALSHSCVSCAVPTVVTSRFALVCCMCPDRCARVCLCRAAFRRRGLTTTTPTRRRSGRSTTARASTTCCSPASPSPTTSLRPQRLCRNVGVGRLRVASFVAARCL